jgi:hypothetical protein
MATNYIYNFRCIVFTEQDPRTANPQDTNSCCRRGDTKHLSVQTESKFVPVQYLAELRVVG